MKRGDASADERAEAVRLRLLGGFAVSVGSRKIGEGSWRLKNAASLVKLLALAPGHRLHRERVMDLLWPNLGARAASNNLRGALHAARRTLETDPASPPDRHLRRRGEQLELCPDGRLLVDVEAFEEAAMIARRGRDPAAYLAAVELYTGDLLPGDRYEEWAEGRRRELRATYLALLVELAGHYGERGEHDSALETLEQAVTEEPTLEEAHAALMRLHAISGRSEEALTQFGRLRAALYEEFGGKPGTATRRLRDEIAGGGFLPFNPVAAPLQEPAGKHNLPAPRTSFVGRERELLELKRTLAMTRLLTLTGMGGSGKTRLALEVARTLTSAYPDGSWLVELAPLSEVGLVPQAVASVLGVREKPNRALYDVLTEELRPRTLLLVLDNCEHLLDASASLANALLDTCPRLRILATSREPLGVQGETLWRVSPLSVPGTDRLPAAGELTRHDAVRLFLDRARLRLPGFELTPENGGPVAEVCRRLEGIPLAIELATARMGALAVEDVAQRLEESLDLLSVGPRNTSPRQRTMRATLEWSYGLLSEQERLMFSRFSAFAGGWTLEAAEAVGDGPGEMPASTLSVMDLLSSLVDKSLVVAEVGVDGTMRYRMLEPVRQYAHERLGESEESSAVCRRHAAFFLSLAEEAEPELKAARLGDWLERLEREHDNFRAALSWAMERNEAELALRLSAALGEFWHMRGHLREGRRWLEAALARGDAPSLARVRALAKASWIAWEQTDLDRAVALGEEGLELARNLGDEESAAAALLNVGVAVMLRGELERAAVLFEEGLPLFRELGSKGGLARSCHAQGCLALGIITMLRGDRAQDFGRAKALLVESLAVSRESGDVYSSGLALNQLSLMPLLQGDYRRAETLCKECLELGRQSGMVHNIAFALQISAALAGTRGQPVGSARLWGAAEQLREAIGTAFSPLERRTFEPYVAVPRDQIEDSAWEAAWQEGRAMNVEEAIQYALTGEADDPSRPRASEQRAEVSGPLTRREREVATLVARGLTNRQVASELTISEHTVATHIAKILKKLGLNPRSQFGAWLIEQRPSGPDQR